MGVFLGFILGIPFGLIALLGSNSKAGGAFAGFGIFSIIILPILYGVFFFIGGIIGTFLFNLAAKIAGGITIDAVQVQQAVKTQ